MSQIGTEAINESVVRRWKRYPAYKDSDVDWLGVIPAHWEVKRLRFTCKINPVKSELSQLPLETKVSFLPMERIREDGYLELEETRTIEEVWQGYTYFRNRDVIIAKITPCFENGKGALCSELVNSIGFGTTELHVIRANEEIEPKFIFYLSKTQQFRALGAGAMYGVAGQQRVPEDFIKDFRLGLPNLREQQAIASFLDRETAKIDTLIAKKGQLIQLLQEKRTALISHAVTKGLNLDVPMKDSGVEWLGEIPTQWEVKRLKNVCSLLRDGTHQPPPRTDIGVPLLSVRNIVNGRFINLDDDSLISEEDFQDFQRSLTVQKDDVLLAIVGATLGKVAIVEEMPLFAIQRSLAVLRPRPHITHFQFLSFFLQSSAFQRLLWKSVDFSAQPGIYLGALGNFHITVPSVDEQLKVIAFLDRETANIDTLIAKICTGIEHLKEYRTALISSAVTGKIDVCEIVNAS